MTLESRAKVVKTRVIVNALLHGKGLVIACHARANALSDHSPATRCSILKAPQNLPDGIYEVRFLDQSAFVRRENGVWADGVSWPTASPALDRVKYRAGFVNAAFDSPLTAKRRPLFRQKAHSFMHGLKVRGDKIRIAARHLQRGMTKYLLQMEHGAAAPEIVHRECVSESVKTDPNASNAELFSEELQIS